MSERLSRERLDLYLRIIKGSADPNARATASFIEAHIAALEAENEQLRWALGTIAYDTSLSVPLGQEPEAHYRMMTGSCISTAAYALAALDEEVGE